MNRSLFWKGLCHGCKTNYPSPNLVLMLRVLLLAVATFGLLLGCSAKSGAAKKVCYPTKGQLLVQNKPAAGVLLIFRPKDDPDAAEWASGFPHATSDAQGNFVVGTYADTDGAPAGQYTVLAMWTVPDPKNEEASSPDKLGGRYSDPDKSKLTATVEAKPTELAPINLQ